MTSKDSFPEDSFNATHEWLRSNCKHSKVTLLLHLLPGKEHIRDGNYRCNNCGMQISKTDYEFLEGKNK